MKNFIKKVVRGAGWLPHVGRHPGNSFMIIMPLVGLSYGIVMGSFIWGIVGAVVLPIICGPLYIYGCIDRARISDRLEDERLQRIGK